MPSLSVHHGQLHEVLRSDCSTASGRARGRARTGRPQQSRLPGYEVSPQNTRRASKDGPPGVSRADQEAGRHGPPMRLSKSLA